MPPWSTVSGAKSCKPPPHTHMHTHTWKPIYVLGKPTSCLMCLLDKVMFEVGVMGANGALALNSQIHIFANLREILPVCTTNCCYIWDWGLNNHNHCGFHKTEHFLKNKPIEKLETVDCCSTLECRMLQDTAQVFIEEINGAYTSLHFAQNLHFWEVQL